MEAGERFALPSAGDVVGNWRIIRFLGEGRSGTVFEVRGLGDDPRVGALKIHLGHTRKATREEFGKEIDFVAGQLIPGCMPAFHDRGFWRGHPFFVMELAERLPRHLPPRRLRRLISHVARALGSLHDKGYIHCDVKPDNIGLIDGRAVLLDFGSVRERKDAQRHPTRVGTWDYMAPEVRESVQLDPRADIYALGVTLGKLCDHAGRRSFESLVVHATANNPDDRPQTVEEFRRELNTAQDRLARFKIVVKKAGRTFVAFLMVLVLFCGFRYILTLMRDQETIQNNTDFETARECYKRGDHTNEVKYLLSVATSNSRWKRQACRILAIRYREGQGVEQDLEKSRAFHDEANKGESQ